MVINSLYLCCSRYQVDLLKDQLEDMEEELIEVQRLHKDRCKVSLIDSRWDMYHCKCVFLNTSNASDSVAR